MLRMKKEGNKMDSFNIGNLVGGAIGAVAA